MKVEIPEAKACPNHIHLLVSIPPYMSVAQFVGTFKSKSALMLFDRHANLKYKYGSRNFWCRGYYVDTVGKNEKMISQYIRNQLEEDYTSDQVTPLQKVVFLYCRAIIKKTVRYYFLYSFLNATHLTLFEIWR